METNQPSWTCVANLGDNTPLEYGGAFLLVDETGVYDPELAVWDEPTEDDRYEVYRFSVERLYKVEHEDRLYYVHKGIRDGFEAGTLPYPIDRYEEWFQDDLDDIDAPGALLCMLLDEDPRANAAAYLSIAGHFGMENFDSDPLHMGKRELIEWANEFLPGADLND
jgi:hypothetical protein